MVEILERGQVPADRVYVAQCPTCGSRLRFKMSEARYSTDQRDGDAVVVTCPVCTGQVWTDAKAYQKTPSTDAA